jgi:DNA-binding MarR family transcriptional regulator
MALSSAKGQLVELPVKKRRTVADRWTPALTRSGHVPIVRTFLRSYSRLKPAPITVGEAMFIVHLMDFKWDGEAPFPGYKTLGKYMGVSDKMARRHAQSLEVKGYLVREMRVSRTNKFDLTPLFKALERALTEK